MFILCQYYVYPMGFTLLQLCTKVIEKDANPEWNQLINLQVKVRKIGHQDVSNGLD